MSPSYAEAGLELSVDGPVASIVLDRPDQLNAQRPEMWAALRGIGAELAPAVRVVVVRANGRAFSAGLDRAMLGPDGIGALASLSDEQADQRIQDYQAGFTWLRRPGIVSVAAVQGHAVGAGFQLALACDLRVLATDAQLCMAETSLGIVPDLAGSKPLVDAVGYSRALEICLTGRRVGAEEAARLGLAALVVAPDELESATADLVAALLTAPAEAVRETKALLSGAGGRDHDEQESLERSAQIRRLRELFRP